MSPRIQNEIIDVAGQLITKQLVQRINNVKYFSAKADEITDVSDIEQFSLCARYLDKNVDTGNSSTEKIPYILLHSKIQL